MFSQWIAGIIVILPMAKACRRTSLATFFARQYEFWWGQSRGRWDYDAMEIRSFQGPRASRPDAGIVEITDHPTDCRMQDRSRGPPRFPLVIP